MFLSPCSGELAAIQQVLLEMQKIKLVKENNGDEEKGVNVGVTHKNGNGVKPVEPAIPVPLPPPVSPEETLLEEYHDLVDLEMDGEISEAQAARLREVQTQLDTLDVQDPHEQAINVRIKQTGDELDAMLAQLRSFPAKVS